MAGEIVGLHWPVMASGRLRAMYALRDCYITVYFCMLFVHVCVICEPHPFASVVVCHTTQPIHTQSCGIVGEHLRNPLKYSFPF